MAISRFYCVLLLRCKLSDIFLLHIFNFRCEIYVLYLFYRVGPNVRVIRAQVLYKERGEKDFSHSCFDCNRSNITDFGCFEAFFYFEEERKKNWSKLYI